MSRQMLVDKVITALQKDGLLTRQQVEQLKLWHDGNVIDFFRSEITTLDRSVDQYLRETHKLPVVCLDQLKLDSAVVQALPRSVCQEHLIIAFHRDAEHLYVAMVDPDNREVLDFLERFSGVTVVPYLTDAKGVRHVVRTIFDTTADAHRQRIDDMIVRATALGTDPEAMAKEAPIIELLDHLIVHALRLNASDLHLEPTESISNVRLRVDGLLHQAFTLPRQLHAPLVARVKILSKIRIDEHLRPQDARFTFSEGDRSIAVRVSIVPALHGPKVVLRFLSTDIEQFDFEHLGMQPRVQQRVASAMAAPQGLILVTGPTGSGKTTTLYSMINTLRQRNVNISTIEDPIEYRIPNITQIQVNPIVDLTFATGLRSILRQDPDIILVGEIRDKETAEIAIHASLTGHLVLSSLHTNSAAAAVTRLLDMGIEPYLIASTLSTVIGQRLVRRVCPHCREDVQVTKWPEALAAAQPPKTISRGRGCPSCLNTGYSGRTGLYEVMPMTEALQQHVVQRATAEQIERTAIEQGMVPLRRDATEKIIAGQTTPEEILRVIQ